MPNTIAYVFPGQGSQVVGMGADVYKASPAARRIFDEADEVLNTYLSKLCFLGTEDELRMTVNAQPALLTTSVATLAAMREVRDGQPIPSARFVAGHSVGEYAALVAAGALPFADALKLVRTRGTLMHNAGQIQEGTMAAILGLDMAGVEQLCQQTGAEIANINCDGQIVVSGPKQALVRAIDLARALGAKRAIPLVVSGAFHSSLMQPAVPGMTEAIKYTSFTDPSIPIISNITATPIRQGEPLRSELVQQITSCVRWSDSVEYMVGHGVNTFVEVGSGTVLTGLVKRIAKDVRTANLADIESVRDFASAAFVE